jgi:hypothetical protein
MFAQENDRLQQQNDNTSMNESCIIDSLYTLFLRKRKGTPGIFHSKRIFAFLVNAKDLAVLYNWEQLLNVSPLVKISILAIRVQQRKIENEHLNVSYLMDHL